MSHLGDHLRHAKDTVSAPHDFVPRVMERVLNVDETRQLQTFIVRTLALAAAMFLSCILLSYLAIDLLEGFTLDILQTFGEEPGLLLGGTNWLALLETLPALSLSLSLISIAAVFILTRKFLETLPPLLHPVRHAF